MPIFITGFIVVTLACWRLYSKCCELEEEITKLRPARKYDTKIIRQRDAQFGLDYERTFHMVYEVHSDQMMCCLPAHLGEQAGAIARHLNMLEAKRQENLPT